MGVRGPKPSPTDNIRLCVSRNEQRGHEEMWLEAGYECVPGYQPKDKYRVDRLICHQEQWVGTVPSCVPVPVPEKLIQVGNETMCPSGNRLCDQLCSVNRDTGEHECSCFKGFSMQQGECRGEFSESPLVPLCYILSSPDLDECSTGTVCQFGKCINTMGSFRCHCPRGFRLEGSQCVGKP